MNYSNLEFGYMLQFQTTSVCLAGLNILNLSNYLNLEFGFLPPSPKGELYILLKWYKCNKNFELLSSLQGWVKSRIQNSDNSTISQLSSAAANRNLTK